MKSIVLAVALCGVTVLPQVGGAEAGVRNGSMEGEAVDHSGGKGLLVTLPAWTPVNAKPARGDRLSVEKSDRQGAGQCLRIKGHATDAGVYQTLAPLQKGTTYLVSAWIKRLSGTLEIAAYPKAWGPRLAGMVDADSEGWTQVNLGLTPSDGGIHLYLAASGRGEFLIDDVQIRQAPVKVRDPEPLPYDLSDSWRYRTRIESQDDRTREVRVQVVSGSSGQSVVTTVQAATVAPGAPASVEFRLPFAPVVSQYSLRLSDPASGELLGGSALIEQLRSPWQIRYPHKNALFASLGYAWMLDIRLRDATAELLGSLRGTAQISDPAGKIRYEQASRTVAGALQMPLSAKALVPGNYRLSVVVKDGAGKAVYQGHRPLRVLPAGPHEVVCDAAGRVRIDGVPHFPIGMYWVFANPADWKPGPARKDAALREMRECGVTVLHSYAFEHSDANNTDEQALAYLDMAQEFGFRVMMGMRRDWYQRERFDLARIERRVRRLKDHPALLCWTLWDEPNLAPNSHPRVKAMYDLIDRVDPYHPAMPVLGGVDGGVFRDCSDAFFFCAYPGPGASGKVTELMARALDAAPTLPTWYVGRAYQWSPGKLPGEEEMTSYWRRALDGGARAIFWYSYGGSATGWDSVRNTAEHWQAFRRANRSLADTVGRQMKGHKPAAQR
jgi:hypothetical protein